MRGLSCLTYPLSVLFFNNTVGPVQRETEQKGEGEREGATWAYI